MSPSPNRLASPAAADRVRSLRAPRLSHESPSQLRADALCLAGPWLAALSIACALAVFWTLEGHVSTLILAGWVGLVICINWAAIRARKRGADAIPSIATSPHWAVPEAVLHAGVWAALPMFAFAGQPIMIQILLGTTLCTMMAGSVLLAVVPVAAALWAILLALALMVAVRLGGVVVPGALALMLPAYGGALLIGCLTVERLLARNISIAARERQGRENAELLLKEYEDQGVGWLWQVDAANLLTYVSPRICGLLGLSTRELMGQSLPVVLGCDARLGAAFVARNPFTAIELEVRTAAGPRWVSMSGNPVLDEAGQFMGFRGVGADVTDVRLSQERLTQLASVDVLTGLPNRQRMRELFSASIARAQAGGPPCAILFLDLDGFKPVNDTFGHPIGDQVLRTVAQRLASEVGPLGQIGRVGGDEFALLLYDGQSRKTVEELAKRLIRTISDPFVIANAEIRIGVSVGCAFAPIDGISVDDLLLKADLALYEAKSQGRGTVRLFESRMQRDADDRLRLEQDLRQALARNELMLHYQPIVSAQTQGIVGFEALLRWQHPERGSIPPSIFVPIAEETQLIAEIGEWVIRQACMDAAMWPDQIFVSVNLSPRQLVLPALPNAISEALTRARLAPNRLELEVTESVFMSDSDGSLDVLRRVRSLGAGIALDDFGTGYSSLGYLNKTIFHTLKIDGSFVRDAATRSETVSIIRAIVALANSFRMTITAEGIETPEDFDRMREFGCHKMQGWLFGRPMAHPETLKLVGGRWDPELKRA